VSADFARRPLRVLGPSYRSSALGAPNPESPLGSHRAYSGRVLRVAHFKLGNALA
jgi:hypothetical protein